MQVPWIALKPPVSILKIYVNKRKQFCDFFMIIFQDFIQLKLGPKIKNLRQGSLNMKNLYKHVRFYVLEMNSRRKNKS